jgi:hypothetical protein
VVEDASGNLSAVLPINGVNTVATIPGAESAVTLTVNTWADGDLTVTTQIDWYVFTAANTGTYYLWLNQGGTSDFGDGTKNGMVSNYVYSSDTSILDSSSSHYYFTGRSFSVTSGETYYVRLTYATAGTYAVGFTAQGAVMPETAITPFSLNTWADGNLSSISAIDWYSFTANTTGTYFLWFNQSGTSGFGDGTKDGRVSHTVYDTSGSTLYSLSTSGSYTVGRPLYLISGQIYYVKITHNTSSYLGDYAVAVSNTSNGRPASATELAQFATATALTADTYATGTSGISSGQSSGTDAKWHSYTVTSGVEYSITLDYSDQLNDAQIQGFYADGSGAFRQVHIYGNGYENPQTFTAPASGLVYIKIWPHSGSTARQYGLKIAP